MKNYYYSLYIIIIEIKINYKYQELLAPLCSSLNNRKDFLIYADEYDITIHLLAAMIIVYVLWTDNKS